jgi:hypothetical protein
MVGAPQVLDPGDHELAVGAPGFDNWSQKFSVPEGDDSEIVVTLTPLPEGQTAPIPGEAPRETAPSDKSFLGPAGWITGSVGVAALIAGTVTLLSRNSRRDELARKCNLPDQMCPSSAFPGGSFEDDKQTVRDLTTATNVLMWGGGALLAGGVTMIVLAGQSSSKGAGTALLAGTPLTATGLTLRTHW